MKLTNKTDKLIIICILIIAGILSYILNYMGDSEKKIAQIYYKTELVSEITLHEGSVRYIDFAPNTNVSFKVHEDGAISFEKSDCPDQVCINTGKLSSVNQSAACIPNEIIVKIVGNEGDDSPDLIVKNHRFTELSKSSISKLH